MKPCWSCGATDEACFDGCECAKCLDPIGYAEWRRENPRAYALWMAENVTEHEERERWYEKAADYA